MSLSEQPQTVSNSTAGQQLVNGHDRHSLESREPAIQIGPRDE